MCIHMVEIYLNFASVSVFLIVNSRVEEDRDIGEFTCVVTQRGLA